MVSARELGALKLIERTTGVALLAAPVTSSSVAAPELAAVASLGGRDARTDTLRISGGRKDKVRPGDILGALTGEAGGLGAADVGRIEIHDHFSYVAVSKSASEAAQRGLTLGRIKGKKFKVTLVA